ncbi:MAG: carbon-nitrogen hydrolase family protein [Balneolaceae bacterium]|nr:carbon-nitrogen hydrolase family protein [Balneolaceae bacterium]
MSSFKVATVQLNSKPDVAHNMNVIYPFVQQAAARGVQLIGLPENFAFLGNNREMVNQAPWISETVMLRIAEWAREFGVYIIAGGFPVPAGDEKVYNRAALFDPNGDVIATYDKIHLFDVTISESESYRESAIMRPGEQSVTVCNVEGLAKIGLSICYDVRFPVLYRKMMNQGAELLSVTSAFTQTTGKAHWEVLLRARAIENTSYLMAPAQTGIHDKNLETYGHAMIIDPWGKVLADAGKEPGFITANIDLNYLNEIREKLPSLKHRVFE